MLFKDISVARNSLIPMSAPFKLPAETSLNGVPAPSKIEVYLFPRFVY